ncbi:MAG TPA: hypothetical protein VHP33_16750 [Polyangiaceae bacterium]|nr:hypothetical protein [Polyangiaceae bacterium]
MALALVGACSNIIGVSGYEIDPALDEDASGGEGAGKGGTESRSGSNTGANGGEGGDGTAGSDIGGKASTGGKGSATAGAGGEPPVPDCTTAAQCDDEIDCTTDSCSAGACVHTPKDTLCDSSQCEVCTVGIGCVSGPKDVVQLLVDPNFDLSAIEWVDSGSDGTNVVTLAGAHSGTNVAKFGPAGPAAEEQDYSDLLQWVTIPEGTVALTLTGWYRATVGTKAPEDDYVVAAFYENGGTRPFSQFHSFEAASSAAPAFKMFSYNALKSDVKEMAGNDYSFDLVAYAWDSVFYFDTLQLNATVCQ